MKLLWVRSDKIGSSLIRWALDSDCSHFAVCFEEDDNGDGVIFHSKGHGTQIVWLSEFLDEYEIVHALGINIDSDDYAAMKHVLKAEKERGYDWPAMAWWAWRALLNKFLGIPITNTNMWQRDGLRLCTGVVPAVLACSGFTAPDIDYEMVKPHDLFKILSDSGKFAAAQEWADRMNLAIK